MKREDIFKIIKRLDLTGYYIDYPSFYDSDFPYACLMFRGDNNLVIFEGVPCIENGIQKWKDVDENSISHLNFHDERTVIAAKPLLNSVKYELDWTAITSFKDVINLIKNVDVNIKLSCPNPTNIKKVVKQKTA